jgi:hypothetical protein
VGTDGEAEGARETGSGRVQAEVGQ